MALPIVPCEGGGEMYVRIDTVRICQMKMHNLKKFAVSHPISSIPIIE